MTNNTTLTDLVWVEKYRPKTINDCLLPVELKKTFTGIVKTGKMPNLMFSGKPGTGKTTIARALCAELGIDYIIINCSEERGIDTLRTTIRSYASTKSLTGGKKAIILDEFDYANPQSMQPALRGAIEEFAPNCNFIMTCNYKSRIIEALHSRCTVIDFTFPPDEREIIAKKMMTRCGAILDSEKITYNPAVLANLIVKHFPDFRRIINELQRYSSHGEIDVVILANKGDADVKELLGFMKNKDFASCRKWIALSAEVGSPDFFRKLYDSLYGALKKQSIPTMVLIVADYQYKAAFVADQEINLTAMVCQLMMECEFE
jgi:DNA polymerase III delta prime subunit